MTAKSQPPISRQPQVSMGRAPATAPGTQIDEKKLRELTAKIAYELYEKRGRSHGSDQADWFAAEKIARDRLAGKK